MNYILDINVILDYFNEIRRTKFQSSIETFNYCYENNENIFLSSSSLDNMAFLKIKELKEDKGYSTKKSRELVAEIIKFLLARFKIAKTPSYVDIDYEDIEDSQIIASAQAINAKVITRDKGMLEKYKDIALTPQYFLDNVEKTYIDFANLKKQYFMYQSELEKEMDKVLNSASYIMSDAVRELEKSLCSFTSAKNAITCSSGTDALLLAMMALDIKPGDEIITTPFTFIATAETIALLGAKPVFVEIDEKTYNIDASKIEEVITPKTKAIIAVSLYGQPCDLDEIREIIYKVEGRRAKGEGDNERSASTVNLQPSIKLIIDGAQSFGATYKQKAEVHHCDIYTTSFFPAKPLGCFGDGGAVLTNSDELAQKMKMLRVHGQNKRYHHKYIGLGARMDTIQAAILNVKLKHYKNDLILRQEVAEKYTKLLTTNTPIPQLPIVNSNRTSAWAQYSVRVKNRDEVQAKLKEQGIPTAVHYPMPLHLQECFAYLGYSKGDFPIAEKVSQEIMSLPMNPYISDEEIGYVCNNL